MSKRDAANSSPVPAHGPSGGGGESGARIGLVYNSRSHRNKRENPRHAMPAEILVAEPQTRDQLLPELRRLCEAEIDLLAISGGDGTVRDVLTQGMQVFGDDWPPLLIVPQGKTNALAVNLGYSQAPPASDWAALLQGGRFATRRPLALEKLDGPDKGRMLYAFLFGAGIFNSAIDAGQTAHRFGAFQAFAVGVTAVYGIAQSVLGFGRSKWRRPFPMEVTVGPEQTPLPRMAGTKGAGRYLLGFSTLRRFPLGIQPFAKAPPSDGVDYFVLDRPSRRAVALLPVALTGVDTPAMRNAGMHRGTASEFRVALQDGFILDGESFPAGTYRITAGPELSFLLP